MANRYLILGANAAGMSAAARIYKFDKEASITVLEKSDVVSFGACGIPYFVAGEFDDIEQMTARPVSEFRKQGMDIRLFHRATSVRPTEKVVKAENIQTGQLLELSYDKLMIAVGARPVVPPIKGLTEGLAAGWIHTMHSRQDALKFLVVLPEIQSVVIIGAGFIGLEAAETFGVRGKQVRIIETDQRVLARTMDSEMTTILESALKRHNVNVHCGETVLEFMDKSQSTPGSNYAIKTSHDTYFADCVVLATGFTPNTEFLHDSDIELSKQGAVIVGGDCRTSKEDIYSAGDCATVPHRLSGNAYIPLATTANKMGRIAGEVMAGQSSRFIGTLGSSGIRVFDCEAGRTGLSETQASQLGLNYKTVFIQDKNYAGYVAGATDMWVKLVYECESRKILGGQICGSFSGGAVHRVDALAVAIYAGLTVDELGMMDFVYAPPFSRTWEILNVAGNVAK